MAVGLTCVWFVLDLWISDIVQEGGDMLGITDENEEIAARGSDQKICLDIRRCDFLSSTDGDESPDHISSEHGIGNESSERGMSGMDIFVHFVHFSVPHFLLIQYQNIVGCQVSEGFALEKTQGSLRIVIEHGRDLLDNGREHVYRNIVLACSR